MQRASESIGALAAALAKAQIELINPDTLMPAKGFAQSSVSALSTRPSRTR